MFDFPKLEKMAYNIESGAELLDMPEKVLTEQIYKHRLRTFRVGNHRYIPNFELDRLLSLLLQEQVQLDMEQSNA
jgi:hypothetical protein